MHRRTFVLGAIAGATLAPGVGRSAAPPPFGWPGGHKAAVSLTYDDGLNSQLDNALPQLEARGLKATFFLTRANMDGRVADWKAAMASGHEVANHTINHPCRLKTYTSGRFEREETRPMEQFLDTTFPGPRVSTFAYPCDNTELGTGPDREARYGALVSSEFQAARTTDGPPNDPSHVLAERFYLHGFEPTYDHDTPKLARRYLDRAIKTGGWAILIFHEILPARMGEGDTSIGVHGQILDDILARPLWCAPMGQVFETIIGGEKAT